MAIGGFNVVVSVASGASATYTAIDGISQFSIGEPREMLDITDFADSTLRRRIAGLRDVSMSLSGDLEPSDAGYQRLRAAFEAGEVSYVRVLGDGTNGKMYAMLVSNLERSAGIDGKVEVSASLEHEGSIDPVTHGSGF